jgi:transporter family protein
MSALVYEGLGAAMAAGIVLALIGFHPESNPKGIGLALLTGFLGMGGALGFYYAVRIGKVSVVVMVTAMYPSIPILLGYFLLKEPISLKEGVGILFAFVALVLFAS